MADNEKRGAHAQDRDGNDMGLTEAFTPVSEDGFTQAMPSVALVSDEGEEGVAVTETADAVEGEAPAHAAHAAHAAGAAVPTITESAGTLPAQKAAHGRHIKMAGEVEEEKPIPEYMRKSHRMRRILIVVIVLLVLLLGGIGYFAIMMGQESDSAAEQQTHSTQQEVDAIQSDEASDAATEVTKTTTVPDLVSLLGLSQKKAVKVLEHGAQVSSTRKVKESGNPIKKEVRVALTAEPADARTGTPTVYLGLDKKGNIIQAGYSVSTTSLGYGSLSFADAVQNENIIEKTLAEAGISVGKDAVKLPEDSSSYTTFEADGKTRAKEYCSFSGETKIKGAKHSWSAVLSYDYAMANASGNLADTVRTIYIYITA